MPPPIFNPSSPDMVPSSPPTPRLRRQAPDQYSTETILGSLASSKEQIKKEIDL